VHHRPDEEERDHEHECHPNQAGFGQDRDERRVRCGGVNARRHQAGVSARQRLREGAKSNAEDWMLGEHDQSGPNEVVADRVKGQEAKESQPRRAIEERMVEEGTL